MLLYRSDIDERSGTINGTEGAVVIEETKSKEEQYNKARILHKSLDEKLQVLEEKPYLTEDEELEVKLLKKKKLYYKDMMARLKGELGKE
ncbi:MAG: DUF465 domain-containing protein [Syntrophorhabdales bacterium]